MKRYTKDGHLKTKKEIVLKKDGKQIINPSEEMILSDGWKEYVAPIYQPTITEHRERKKRDIQMYVDSIKGLIIDDEEVKIDTDTLNKMTFRVMAESAMNKSKTYLLLNGIRREMKVKDALKMLYNLQIYFGELFDVAEEHKATIDSLTTEEDIEAHDYKTGYPEKLRY